MVGWCCCSTWEQWDKWNPHIAHVAGENWKDQIIRLRNHPSVFTWLYGSDLYPPEDVERNYIDIINTYDGTRPYESSATGDSSAIAGYTGFWMGPYPPVYAYFPPSYWYTKLEFNSECSPGGEQIPPIESLRKMMPEEDLWPISKSWDLRLHKLFYPDARSALFSRYGKPQGVEEYCVKSQVMQKEVTRAMFEAFARNKYHSSGVIYWMYNSAWPSLYWQLYDYFLTPNGAFYGTQKACEPLHIQYSYDDKTIYVLNSYYEDFENLEATAKVFNFDMEEKYSNTVSLNISSDMSKKAMDIDWPNDLTDTYFLKLELKNDSGLLISSNFYWLSVKEDSVADFTDLNTLPIVDINASVNSVSNSNDKVVLNVEITNPSDFLAFAVNPSIKKDQSGDLVTPVYWEDNYFSLLPKEKRLVKVEFDVKDIKGEKPVLVINGWNIRQSQIDFFE
jgi:exo-1,4-beta-D-glucosaminidase